MRRTSIVLGSVGLAALAAVVVVRGRSSHAAKSYVADYSPAQPLPSFSHKIHAGDLAMPCQYCHIYARRSIASGVPPLQTCYNCHKLVEGVSPQGKIDVQKIRDAYTSGTPIAWTKVHDLPDFVYYTHKAHIRIGQELAKVGSEGFTCQNCHGPVQEMGTAELRKFDPDLDEKPLTMGWCLTCHIKKSADVALVMKLQAQARARGVAWDTLIGQVQVGETEVQDTQNRLRDCWTCHK